MHKVACLPACGIFFSFIFSLRGNGKKDISHGSGAVGSVVFFIKVKRNSRYNLLIINVTKPCRTFQRFSFAPAVVENCYSLGRTGRCKVWKIRMNLRICLVNNDVVLTPLLL